MGNKELSVETKQWYLVTRKRYQNGKYKDLEKDKKQRRNDSALHVNSVAKMGKNDSSQYFKGKNQRMKDESDLQPIEFYKNNSYSVLAMDCQSNARIDSLSRGILSYQSIKN